VILLSLGAGAIRMAFYNKLYDQILPLYKNGNYKELIDLTKHVINSKVNLKDNILEIGYYVDILHIIFEFHTIDGNNKNKDVTIDGNKYLHKINELFYGIKCVSTKSIIDNLRNIGIKVNYMHIPVRVFNTKNYGDAISVLVIEKIFKIKVEHSVLSNTYPVDDHVISMGSIMDYVTSDSIIWGTGYIEESSYLGRKYLLSGVKPKMIHAVRGKLTRNKLISEGVDCPEVYGDPALLLPLIYSLENKIKYKYGLIPHYVDVNHNLIKEIPDVSLINIMTGHFPYLLLDKISEVEIVISSSLHGLIVAVAYGKPCIWVKFSNRIVGGEFKFLDFFSALDYDATYMCLDLTNSTELSEEILNCYIIHVDQEKVKKVQDDLIKSNPFIN
jgi:pyruvyltransferase